MKHRVRAAALVLQDEQILLVCHKSSATGQIWWIPPGGGLEMGDRDLFACAERETFEEAGLQVSCSRIAYIREFIQPSHNMRHLELFVVADSHAGTITQEHLPPEAHDFYLITEARWLRKADLQTLTVYPEILKQEEFWQNATAGFPIPSYLGCQVED